MRISTFLTQPALRQIHFQFWDKTLHLKFETNLFSILRQKQLHFQFWNKNIYNCEKKHYTFNFKTSALSILKQIHFSFETKTWQFQFWDKYIFNFENTYSIWDKFIFNLENLFQFETNAFSILINTFWHFPARSTFVPRRSRVGPALLTMTASSYFQKH